MKLATSEHISQIDKYAKEKLGISEKELIDRSGRAAARAIRSLISPGGKLIFFCGKGNNGADGYSAAIKLLPDYKIVVYDIFGQDKLKDSVKDLRDKYLSEGGELRAFEMNNALISEMADSSGVIDAIFGTGFKGELPEDVRRLSVEIGKLVGPVKIAIDVPLGVNADDGSTDPCAFSSSATVELSYIKPGIVSFPAKSYVGKIIHDDLDLPIDKINEEFKLSYNYTDEALACELLPDREENSSKGSFGKALIVTGSDKYRGAAALSLEGALRGGAGYVTYCGTEALCDFLCAKFPEAIYKIKPDNDALDDASIAQILKLSSVSGATLIGSGSDGTEGLYRLVCALLDSEGGTLILDADAINVLSRHREQALQKIKNTRRNVILTPHPLEFSRLAAAEVAAVQEHRLSSAIKFASELGCVLVLKGAGTIVTNGKEVYINSSGSSALAKAGSGDVLAGFIASLVASGKDSLEAAALSVYLHGRGADTAIGELSSYGVTPSDLPIRIASQMALLEQKRKNM